MFDVFVSYHRGAARRIEPLTSELARLGYRLFVDQSDIDVGSSFPDRIDRALRTSNIVMACFSPGYFSSKWCLAECRFDDAKLLPIMVERVDIAAFPVDLKHTNYIDMTDWGGNASHAGWQRLCRAIWQRVGHNASTEQAQSNAARHSTSEPRVWYESPEGVPGSRAGELVSEPLAKTDLLEVGLRALRERRLHNQEEQRALSASKKKT